MTFRARPLLVGLAAGMVLVATGCTTGPGTVVATGPADTSDLASAVAPGSPAAKAELAMRLAAQARRDQDARAMLVAARLMLTSGTRPATLEDGALSEDIDGDPIATGWAREAMVLAGSDSALHEEAQAILAMRPRGILRSSLGSGPLRYVRRLAANETIRFNINTQPQAAARVAVIGDGDARIGLSVWALDGRICQGEARTTHSLCIWQATVDRYDVTLENAGPLASDVMLLSN